jgi:hypothetical protein
MTAVWAKLEVANVQSETRRAAAWVQVCWRGVFCRWKGMDVCMDEEWVEVMIQ